MTSFCTVMTYTLCSSFAHVTLPSGPETVTLLSPFEPTVIVMLSASLMYPDGALISVNVYVPALMIPSRTRPFASEI